MKQQPWRIVTLIFALFALASSAFGTPQSASALWSEYHSKIVNDPLNAVTTVTTTVPPLFGNPEINMEVVRYDLGTLTGTYANGVPKTASPKIAAMYAYPKGGTNLPAIVNIHGGGQYPTWADTYLWAARGYAVISINWGGKHMDALYLTTMTDGLSLGMPGANFDNTDWDGLAAGFARDPISEPLRPSVTDPVTNAVHAPSEEVDGETYSDGATLFENIPHPMNAAFILNSYAARRAITFLANRPEVDATKIGALGFSMGGITTTVTATDPRLKCVIPAVGGTGWDYENYYGMTQGNKTYGGSPSTFALYQNTVSQESYWPLIQVPAMFLNGTNDFNAPFDAVQRSIDLLPQGVKGVMVNTPHVNHQPDSTLFTSQALWLEEHLKGSFSFPNEAPSSIDLTHASGVPIFSVTPDTSTGHEIVSVEVFYGDEYFPLERFWHKAVAVETSEGTWQAGCPAFDTSKPLIAFANITYSAGKEVTVGLNATSNIFNITSEVQYLNAEYDGVNELTVNGIVADTARERTLTLADDGLSEWHNNPTYGGNFDYGTFKLGADRFEGPYNGTLQLDLNTTVASGTNVIAVTAIEGWSISPLKTNAYTAYISVPLNGTNSISIAPSTLKRLDNNVTTLPNWSNVKLLKIQSAVLANPASYPTNWAGDQPTISNMRWIGGFYLNTTNEAPSFSTALQVTGDAAADTAYTNSLAGVAIDPEGQAISYSKIAGPAWLTVASNGTLSGTPTSQDAGSNKWVIMAKDPSGAMELASLEINVTGGNTGPTVKVILLGGQSNSVGQAASTGLPVNLQSPQNDVLFYYDDQNAPSVLTTLRPGSGGDPWATGLHFGPEVSFGRALADANTGETYAIIKHGENGTNLTYMWDPAVGPSYTAFQSTVTDGLAALHAAGYNTEIVGMLWMQGESDGFNADASSAYQTNLTAFIADVRSNYGADLPFIIGEITRTFVLNGTDYGPWLSTVADAQSTIGATDPNAAFVSTTDLVFYDGIHFDAASTVTLGERFATALLNLTTPAGPGLDAEVLVETVTPDGSNHWDFATLPAPLTADHGASATISVSTNNAALGGGLTVLNDGIAAANNDDYNNSVRFDTTGPNRLLMDLGGLTSVYEINTYSWHLNVRHNQLFDVYYSTAATAPDASTGANLTLAGWQLVTSVETSEPFEDRQIVSSVRNANGGALADATYILIDVKDLYGAAYTLFSEIDILSDESYSANTPHYWLASYGLEETTGAANFDYDGDGLTAAEEYAAGSDPTDDPSPSAKTRVFYADGNWSDYYIREQDFGLIYNSFITLDQSVTVSTLTIADGSSYGVLSMPQVHDLNVTTGLTLGNGDGIGIIVQSAGTVTTPLLNISGNPYNVSYYDLHGGTLTADEIILGASGELNIKGGTFSKDIAGSGLLVSGDGQLTISSGTFDLFNGSVNDAIQFNADVVIEGGTVNLQGQTFVGLGADATLTVVGDEASINILALNQGVAGNQSVLNFVLDADGVSPLQVSNWATLSQAELTIDGSAYTGGAAEITLISSGYLVDDLTAANVSVSGFEASGLIATIEQDAAGAAGDVVLVLTPNTQPFALIDGINGLNVNSGFLLRDDAGFQVAPSSAWSYANGTLSNSSQNVGAESDGAAAIIVNLAALTGTAHDQLEISFDYDLADSAEALYVHVWGYVENATASTAGTLTMNLGASHGQAWEQSDIDATIGVVDIFDDYNLGWQDGAWDANGATHEGQNVAAAIQLTGTTGPQSYSAVFDLSSNTLSPALVAGYDYLVIGIARHTASATTPAASVSNLQVEATTSTAP